MATSVYEQLLLKVQETIQGLSLTDITSGQVVLQSVQDTEAGNGPTVAGYPVILIAPGVEESNPDAGTNLREEIIYPVLIVLVDDEARSHASAYRDKWMLWREQIRQAFLNRRISGITGAVVIRCTVQHQAAIDRAQWFADRQVGGMAIRCVTWE